MIAKQYKKGTRTGVERGKNGYGKGSRTGLERGKNGVGTGAKTGFKRHKNGISSDSTIWNGVERPFFAVPPLFSPVFDDFAKYGKKGRQKWRNGKGKKSVLSSFFPVPFFSLSFPCTSLVPTTMVLFS